MKRSKLFFPVISTLSVFILGIGNAYSSNNDAIIKNDIQYEEFLRIDHAGGAGRGGYSGSFGSGYGGGYSGGASGNGRYSNNVDAAKAHERSEKAKDIADKERREREEREREDKERDRNDRDDIDWSDPDNW